MSEFKPCPFCGGNEQEVGDAGDCGELFSVLCSCGAETDYHESDWSAVNQWNKRQDDKVLTETLRLKELENQQLAQDKAELVGALKTAISWLAVDGQWEGSPLQFKFNKLLEKHK